LYLIELVSAEGTLSEVKDVACEGSEQTEKPSNSNLGISI
jgi:hypothetical protein